jgi:regulator of protease activity HflC (stomatin/prohibitin superfamily)
MDYLYWAAAALLLVALVLLVLSRLRLLPTRATVYEFEKGLRYTAGRFRDTLGPGQYWVIPSSTTIMKVDVRPRLVSLPGQEVLSADGVTLKASLAARYEVVDPETAVNKVQDYQSALYVELQLGLREIVGSAKIEEVLEKRGEIGSRLTEATAAKAAELGIRLHSVDVKDITFPGDLKKVFSQVVRARQEGLAALEKARGETAALRNLANAARLVDEKPALLQLRLLQQLGEGSGNTLVLGVPPAGAPLPLRSKEGDQQQLARPTEHADDQG